MKPSPSMKKTRRYPSFLLQEDNVDWDLVSDDVCDVLIVSNGEDLKSGFFTSITPEELIREQLGDPFSTNICA